MFRTYVRTYDATADLISDRPVVSWDGNGDLFLILGTVPFLTVPTICLTTYTCLFRRIVKYLRRSSDPPDSQA